MQADLARQTSQNGNKRPSCADNQFPKDLPDIGNEEGTKKPIGN